MMAFLPSVNQDYVLSLVSSHKNLAYAIIISDESQKSMSSASSAVLFGVIQASHVHDPTLIYSKTVNSKFKKNFNLFCKFCKMKGLTKHLL